MTLVEKFENLTPEQRKRFTCAVSEQELDTALAEANITLTAEEKGIVLEEIVQMRPKELSDEEAEQAAGGAGFRQCPHGHYEATGFANKFGSTEDCEIDACTYFKRSELYGTYVKNFLLYHSQHAFKCKERCDFFNREIEREYTVDREGKYKSSNW